MELMRGERHDMWLTRRRAVDHGRCSSALCSG